MSLYHKNKERAEKDYVDKTLLTSLMSIVITGIQTALLKQ